MRPSVLALLLALPAGALQFKSSVVKVNDAAPAVEGRPADPREAELAETAARYGLQISRLPVDGMAVYELYSDGGKVGNIRIDDKGAGDKLRGAIEERLGELGAAPVEEAMMTDPKAMSGAVAGMIRDIPDPKPECTERLARNRCHGPVGKWDGCVDLFMKVWSKGRNSGEECRPKARPAAEQS
jgi:hypothetical protein